MLKRNMFLVLLVLIFSCVTNFYSQDAVSQVPNRISKGVVNGSAISLPKPAYPAAALAVKASGAVNVRVLINVEGNVESAEAISGHPLLRSSAVEAAKNSKFKPTLLGGVPVEVTGIIVYSFIGQKDWDSIGLDIGFAEIRGLKSPINLPSGFLDEQKTLSELQQNSFEIQQSQLPNVVALIKAKLNEPDLWLFEYGVAKAKVLTGLSKKDDGLILSNLATFKALAENVPANGKNYLEKRAIKLAEFADKNKLTKEDKEIILQYLR